LQKITIKDYAQKLRDAHFGELVGEKLFSALASRFPQHKLVFETLSAVEHRVGNRLAQLLEKYRVTPVPEAQVAELTNRLIMEAKPDDWLGWLHRFHAILTPFVAKFDDLYTYGPASDSADLLLLRDHERMLLKYVEQELAGEDGLPVVTSFLQRGN